MLSSNLTLVIAVILVVVGMAEFVHPFGPAFLRTNPILVVILGALLAARHAAHSAARKRQKMLDEVPEKPLGLSDD